MTAGMAMPGNTAETFLVHFFGTGLADDRYVVERFRARADGDIVTAMAEALAAKGRRKVKRTMATLKAVKEPRPGYCAIASRRADGPLPGRPAGLASAGRPTVHSRIRRKGAIMACRDIAERRRRNSERFHC